MKIELIKTVQQYFAQKLINGEYEPIDINPNYVEALVDNQFSFVLWVASGEKYFRTWESISRYFIRIPEFTADEQAIGYANAMKIVTDNSEKIRLAEIARLEQELNKLKSIEI